MPRGAALPMGRARSSVLVMLLVFPSWVFCWFCGKADYKNRSFFSFCSVSWWGESFSFLSFNVFFHCARWSVGRALGVDGSPWRGALWRVWQGEGNGVWVRTEKNGAAIFTVAHRVLRREALCGWAVEGHMVFQTCH